MKRVIEVVAGLVLKDGRIIMAKRKKGDPLEGLWEFPGGKVEDGEDLFQALKRELKEELNIEAKPLKKLTEIIHHYPHISFRMHLIMGITEDEPTAIESDEIGLFKPEEIDKLELAEADRIAWRKIRKNFKDL